MRWLPLLVIFAACANHQPTPEAALGGVEAITGELQATMVAVPEFSVLSHDGQARSRADLMGHPTVLWFFPAAGTPG